MQQGIDLQTGANLPDIGAGIEMEVGGGIDDVLRVSGVPYVILLNK